MVNTVDYARYGTEADGGAMTGQGSAGASPGSMVPARQGAMNARGGAWPLRAVSADGFARSVLLSVMLAAATPLVASAADGAAQAPGVPVATSPAVAPVAQAASPATPSVPAVAAPAGPGAPAAPSAPAIPAGAVPSEETNPFSNVRPADNQALKQQIPVLEQRLRQVEDRMSAIQQVQAAVPAEALGGPGGHSPGGAGGIDDQSIELEAATFVACVNGKAMFRDSDQKPFFVDAKEASQNEAVRRVGGCKH